MRVVAPSFGLRRLHALIVACACASCANSSATGCPDGTCSGMPPPRTGPGSAACSSKASVLPADPQESGDPQAGRWALLNGSYMSCGIPLTLWQNGLLGPIVQGALGTDGEVGLAGREGDNAALPSSLVSFTTTSGAKVVNLSCLKCHGARFDGEYVIGLGNTTADFTNGITNNSLTAQLPDGTFDLLGLNPAERASLEQMLRVGRQIGPGTAMRTVGNNPAEALSGVLFTHHDQKTLAWSDRALVSLDLHDENGNLINDPILTSDPPPWWRVKKKNALFYNGMSRGQHRGTEEIATLVCVTDLDEAKRVDAIFRDIQAYIGTISAPTWPSSAATRRRSRPGTRARSTPRRRRR